MENDGIFPQKIPLNLLNEINMKDMLQKSAMDIFYWNEMKLTELQEELTSSCSLIKIKEITVKVYSIFENLSYIFQKLGITELYNQVRLIFNTITKMVVSSEPKQPAHGLKMKKQMSIDEEITQKQYLKQNKPEQYHEAKKRRLKKPNKMRGIFLYNQSYVKHVERINDKQSDFSRKMDLRDTQDPIDIEDEFHRQQMHYFLSRKKQLSVIKIKDHSKSYQEIQNEFRLVQQRLKRVLQNLQVQFEHQNIQQFQFLSKQQISKQLLNFNSSMRTQLVMLKEQYDSAIQNLRNQNFALRNQLNQLMNSKDSMVSSQTQTYQTVSSIKKVKRLVEQYQVKVKKLENKIIEGGKREKEIEEKLTTILDKKQMELCSAYQNITSKQELIKTFKMRCFNYEQAIKQLNEKLQHSIEKENEQPNAEDDIKNEDYQDQDYRILEKMKGKKNYLNSRLSLRRRTFNPGTRHSQYSTISKSDQAEEGEASQPKINPLLNKTSKLTHHEKNARKSNKLDVLKWGRNASGLQDQKRSDLSRKPIRKQNLTYHHSQTSSFNNQKEQIQMLKNTEIKSSQKYLSQNQHVQKTVSFKNLISTNNIKSSNKIEQIAKASIKMLQRKDKTKSVLQQSASRIGNLDSQHLMKNIISLNPGQNNEIVQMRKQYQFQQNKGLENKPTLNRLGVEKFIKSQQGTKLQKQSRFRGQAQQGEKHILVEKNNDISEIKDIPSQQIRIKPGYLKELRQNHQKLASNLSEDQISTIADKLMRAGKINDKILSQIDKDHPFFLSEMKNFECSRKMYEQLNKLHQKRCHEKPCRHLQIFVDFCSKFKQGINNNKRLAMKLYVQNFQNV